MDGLRGLKTVFRPHSRSAPCKGIDLVRQYMQNPDQNYLFVRRGNLLMSTSINELDKICPHEKPAEVVLIDGATKEAIKYDFSSSWGYD